MLETLQKLYGNDIFNVSLLIAFELFSYLIYGLLGGLIREYFLEQDKCLNKIKKVLGSAIISALIMFVFGNLIKSTVKDNRLFFGVSLFIAIYLPMFKKRGLLKIIKAFVGVYSDKIRKFLDDIDNKK